METMARRGRCLAPKSETAAAIHYGLALWDNSYVALQSAASLQQTGRWPISQEAR